MQNAITLDDKVVELHDDGSWRRPDTTVSCLEKCRALEHSAEVVALFNGLFERLAVHIIDTGEEFVFIHRGDRVDFEASNENIPVDFGISIYSFQVDHALENAATGYNDEVARFYLVRELFHKTSSGTRNTFNHPLTSNRLFRWMIQGKNLIHVYLQSPDPDEVKDAMYTLFFIYGRWHVVKGLYGSAKRVFRISVQDAWEFQRQIYAGMKSNSWGEWFKIARWYVGWRKKVEVPSVVA